MGKASRFDCCLQTLVRQVEPVSVFRARHLTFNHAARNQCYQHDLEAHGL
jgi:hypothetical protein